MREILTTILDLVGLAAVVAAIVLLFGFPWGLLVLGAACILISRVATR